MSLSIIPKNASDTDATETENEWPADVDDLVDRLFDLVQNGFDRPRVLRLGLIPHVDEISRVETELRFLDLFAVYLAIVRRSTPVLRQHSAALFKRLCVRVLTSWAPAWDTRDDIVEVLNGRFAAYNRLVKAVDDAGQPDDLVLHVSLFAALLIQRNRTVFSDDRQTAGESALNVVERLVNQNDLILTTVTELFQNRFAAVSQLLSDFSVNRASFVN